MRNIFLWLLLVSSAAFSQNYPVDHISPELLENADAVIRNYQRDVFIENIDEKKVITRRVVTVLNQAGERYVQAYEVYDKSDDIEEQELFVYDSNGQEIEHIKQKDFRDESAYASFILYSDNRVSYFDYMPRRYPYTVEYISETVTPNTIFIREWEPLEGYRVSTEKSTASIHYPEGISLRWKSRNLENYDIQVDSVGKELKFQAKNIASLQRETYTPSFSTFAPRISVSMNQFYLEGVEGEAQDWKQFGKWMYDNLVEGLDELPQSTVQKMTSLVADAKSEEEKIRRIYQFVQDNTRYIAVMYGIGGWKPFTAREVDDLGYGDCKALTNYTKALLKTQGIESYYTVIYGGNKRDIEPDFARMQGNHVILNVPRKDSADFWLECTSQKVPFDYMGDFTDDRFALLIKPEGGEIIKTKVYQPEDNLQAIDCKIQLAANGGFQANFTRTSRGVPYGEVFRMVDYTDKEVKEFYRDDWKKIQNIQFENYEFENDREQIVFTEKINFSGERLATSAGSRLLVPLNFIQQSSIASGSGKTRKLPMQISRGKSFQDHFEFTLPENFVVEALPESTEFEAEFGKFSISITADDNSVIEVERHLQINQGDWPASKYQEFRKFINKVNHLNNLKAVIVEKTKT